MKAITFLGIARYSPTTYVYGDLSHHTDLFPDALCRFVKPSELLVFVTGKARDMHFDALCNKLAGKIEPRGVSIPEGRNEDELWQIFDALTEEVNEGDEVVFDITNAFRSIPFLVFLAAAYLKAAKHIGLRAVLYGAYEARDEANHSPVFDLTSFVQLLDWLTATDRFVQMGDGRALAELLRAGIPPGPQMRDDLEARAMGNHLRVAADAMDKVSLALWVTRPLEAMQAAARLDRTLDQARPSIARLAQPFGVMADQVRAAYVPFALTEPVEAVDIKANLRIQLAMVRWYLDKGQVVQAATLAREWLVSLLVWRLRAGDLLDQKNARWPVEQALNNLVEESKPSSQAATPSRFDEAVRLLRVSEELGSVWSKLRDLRNDLAHVGMNAQARPAAKLCRDAEELYPILEQLASVLLRQASC